MNKKNLKHIKSPGFNVPKDYFDAFEYRLLDRINAEESIISTKSTGFKAPEGYFNTLEDRIINMVSEEKETKVISLLNRKTIVYVSSVAAAALVLFNLSIFNNNISIEDLEVGTVENYILDEDISSYEIASLFSDELPTEDSMINYNLNEENLEEYLLNNADIESLMVE